MIRHACIPLACALATFIKKLSRSRGRVGNRTAHIELAGIPPQPIFMALNPHRVSQGEPTADAEVSDRVLIEVQRPVDDQLHVRRDSQVWGQLNLVKYLEGILIQVSLLWWLERDFRTIDAAVYGIGTASLTSL